jgi:hypothetical protein
MRSEGSRRSEKSTPVGGCGGVVVVVVVVGEEEFGMLQPAR